MALKQYSLFRALVLVGIITSVTASWVLIEEIARSQEYHYDRLCVNDYLQNMCYSPGLCPQKVYYCDWVLPFGMCLEITEGLCYEPFPGTNDELDNCGLKRDCLTGNELDPPEYCWTPVCEQVP